VEDVRYSEFMGKLRLALVAARGNLVIALRVDGNQSDYNILLRTDNLHERKLRVLASPGMRAESWNIVTTITNVIMRNRAMQPREELPDKLQNVFELGINSRQSGWVVLRVRDHRPVEAKLVTVP